MIGFKFHDFHIQNGRVFRNETITLANQGIVSVLGKNAAGKSTIFNLLQVPFYGSTPTGHKKDDLVKNGGDSTLQVNFERSGVPHELAFKRRKKKWGYQITEDTEDKTPHTFNDSVKKAATLLGITQAEFEGSVHLTQGSQHILISGKPTKRKEYISNFFGIDDSYDQVQIAAKEKLQTVKDQITKVSALSHTKSILEQEMGLIIQQDPKPLIAEIELYTQRLEQVHLDIKTHYDMITEIELYEQLLPLASRYENPAEEIKIAEESVINLKAKAVQRNQLMEQNRKAREVNETIHDLRTFKADLEASNKDIQTLELKKCQDDLSELTKLKHANWTLNPLRKELKTLPDLKPLPIENIEEQFQKVLGDLNHHKRRMAAIAKGECPECGSHFKTDEIENEKSILHDLQEAHQILKQDLEIVKQRNQKTQRRGYILQTIGDVREFTEKDKEALINLTNLLKSKASYDEAVKALSILQPQEIKKIPNLGELEGDIAKLSKTIEEMKVCLEASNNLPTKPTKTREQVLEHISKCHEEDTSLTAKKSQTNQKLGQVKADNERLLRLQVQLQEITVKLGKLNELKKDEFFWTKMVEAYGPRGLRVEQLNKMMDVVIRRLPVYTGILFDEKGLTFEHRCDANNIEILACRQEETADGEIKEFKHDISSFSGGEQGKMSTSFVLTLADCVPPSKRSNILILDEVDSALDEDGQFRFTNDLLPMLRQNYESVFVVSHSQEIQQAAVYDQVWTVKKENHWSSIERVKTSG